MLYLHRSDFPRRARAHVRAAFLVSAACALASSARAHVVAPTTLNLRAGAYDYFRVTDQGSCAASITVTTDRPDLLDLCLYGGSGPICVGCGTDSANSVAISETFYVCAAATDPATNKPWTSPQVATITVCWVGVGTDIDDNPCPEDNCGPGGAGPVIVTVVVTPDPLTAGQQDDAGRTPDPISTRTGELFFTETADLVVRGPLPLVFQRYYASQLAAEGNASSDLGPNWLHNFSWKLVQTGNNVEVVTPRGRVLLFENSPLSGLALLSPLDQPYELFQGATESRLGDRASGLVYVFDLSGRLVRIEDANGNVLTLSYTGLQLDQVADALGRTLDLTYLPSGLIDAVSDGTRTVTFGYSAALELEMVLDPAGGMTTYAYDAAHPQPAQLVARMDPTGRTQNVQAYDGSGQVATQTNAYGGALGLSYPGPSGGDTDLTNALGDASTHTHAASGVLTDVTDENASSYGYTYDAQGRRVSRTDRLGGVTRWTYDATSGLVSSITAANGAVTSFNYASRSLAGLTFYDLASVARADGTTESFARDANGNVTSYTDPAGNVWSLTYSTAGKLLTVVNPLGGVHTFDCAPNGDILSRTDPSGDTTNLTYDVLHRLVQVARADGSTASVTYDALDRIVERMDGTGATTSYAWDEGGRLLQRTDATTSSVTWSYDAMGWLQSRTRSVAAPASPTENGGATSSLTRDELGRVLSTIDPTGLITQYGSDPVGNVVSVTPPSGGQWSIDPDAESVTEGITDPFGNTWDVTTNSMGWVTRLDSPEGRVRSANYDVLGRATQLTAPGGASIDLAYTPKGELEGTCGPLGSITTFYQRNALGDITVATDANGEDWTSTYDLESKRTSFATPLGASTTFGYDARDRVNLVTLADSTTATVTRDQAGRPVQTWYSTGETFDAVFTPTGQLWSARNVSLTYDLGGDVVDSNGIGIGRDLAGRPTSLVLGPGRTVTYDWGNDDFVDFLTDWVGGMTTFTWFPNGNLATITYPNGVTASFTYDNDGLLTGIDYGAKGSIQLQRGPSGAVVQADRALPQFSAPLVFSALCVYGSASRLTSSTYDLRGRTLTGGSYSYGWGPGRIKSLSDGVWTADFEHDAFGQLTRRTVGGVMQDFDWVYGLGRPVVGVISENGAPTEAVVPFVDGTPLYTADWNLGLRSFMSWDEQGSVVFRTDEAGACTDGYSYDTFGGLTGETGTRFNDLFAFRATHGWLREELTAAGVNHYHHGEGGGVYRVDQGRDLGPDHDPDDPLAYRVSPYSIRDSFRLNISSFVAGNLQFAEGDLDELGYFRIETNGTEQPVGSSGVLGGLAAVESSDSLRTQGLYVALGYQPNVALRSGGSTLPASNRAVALGSQGIELFLGGRYMGAAGVQFVDDFFDDGEGSGYRLIPTGPYEFDAWTSGFGWRPAGESPAFDELEAASELSAGRIDRVTEYYDLSLDEPGNSVSPSPGPASKVHYFSPSFVGFQVPAVFSGADRVADEIDAYEGFAIGIGTLINF